MKYVALSLSLLALPPSVASASPAPGKLSGGPFNIVVILADDLGYADLPCFGSKLNQAPRLDQLASEGTRFTDFHANGPVCSPTRAALLTGRYQQRCGVENVFGDDPAVGLALSVKTLPQRLRQGHYATAIYGKWHLGLRPPFTPRQFGFDDFRGHMYGDADYFSHIDRLGARDWWHNDELSPQAGYATVVTTDNAVEFIRQHRERPFFLYVPYTAVHFPWQGPNDHAQREVGKNYWDPKIKFGLSTDRKATLRAMIASLDAGVGRIVDTLRELGLDRKTFLMFTSDNGGYDFISSNAPFRGTKGDVYEGGHREPAIFWWPGRIAAGRVSDATAATIDVLPTALALAGLPLPAPADQPTDGINLLPHLLDEVPLPDRTLFWRAPTGKAARRGPWKLVLMPTGPDQLYNLADDPGETRNIASAYPDRLSQLRAEMGRWERDVGASFAALTAGDRTAKMIK